MKLGDVLKKERVNKEVSQEETAERLGISLEDYQQMENGESPAESWGPTLAQIAITLETPRGCWPRAVASPTPKRARRAP
jgi:transcriptional regulator with XRE-family HTH domain